MGKVYVVLWLVLAIGYGVFYLLAPWIGAQRLASIEPQLSAVPLSLTTQTQAGLSNSGFDAYGFNFLLPNKEIVTTRRSELITVVSFHDGGGLMLLKPSPLDISILRSAAKNGDRAEKVLGPELLQSNFNLMQAAMLATPEQVKWWRFRSTQNQRTDFLLLAKALALIKCSHLSKGPVYTISFGQFHGFQCGNPNVAPYDAHIEVFDQADRHFALDVSGPSGHGQVLTQEELNAMVASIRHSPAN